MGVVVRVIKSARALLRAHAIASSDAVRSQHLDAALALLGTARDSTEASTAERLTCAILAAHPSDSLTELTWRADTALEHDDLAAAQIELDAALALDATHADNYARRANVHVRNSKHRRALADAEKALALEPRHVGARAAYF
jgi:Tfp pilus assembly protein PilF